MLRAALVAICLAVFSAAAVAAGKTHSVRIEGMKFIPERLEVAAGDTVVWTNKDFLPHSVTAREARVEFNFLVAQLQSLRRARTEVEYDLAFFDISLRDFGAGTILQS